ncbi:hypothetical protein [Tardiphaga sp.]|jgi:hypothetical protein|uniref:hypothetical protein n=1 Tax=Tardiphaga sp. TaxID=1926292 RepID=UPI0037DA11A0
MAADQDRDQAGSRACIGAHAATGGDQASALPMSAQDAQQTLAIDDLLPLAIPMTAQRGRGRPAGSVNIRTNKTFQAAVSRYGDPLIAQIAMGNANTKDLITDLRKIASDCGLKLGATVMDVVRFQASLRESALPYGHSKRVAVDEKGNDVLPVFVMGGAAGSTTNVQVNSVGLEDRIEAMQKAKQDQQHNTINGEVSHDGKSHDD